MPGPLVVKVRYDAPSAKDAAAHAVYMATRPGTDLTVTADSLARMARREVSDDATYTRYIAERPGVVADGEAHGLFDEDGVPDLSDRHRRARGALSGPGVPRDRVGEPE